MFQEYSKKDQEVKRRVGERIKFLREQKGLSIDRLAIEAELSKNQVWRIENYKHNTSLVALNRIAFALDVPLKTLFEFDSDSSATS